MNVPSLQSRTSAGFTLIELMIVVVITGLLASLAIPKFSLASAKTKEKEADGVLKQVYVLQHAFMIQNGRMAVDAAELTVTGFAIPDLRYYSWNDALDLSPYCLSATPAGATHANRCIDLLTGDLSDSA
jgi:prepilin-type N-terminal cleavage/methylation domain-containing protein